MGVARFLQLTDVAEVLNISSAQAYALVRSGELAAIKIGGRGQWRIEASELESYIERLYAETRQFVQAHPFGGRADEFGAGEPFDPAGDGRSARADDARPATLPSRQAAAGAPVRQAR